MAINLDKQAGAVSDSYIYLSGKNSPENTMRLTQAEQITIIEVIRRRFGEDAKIWLYGTRIDPYSIGQDIDLYVEASLSKKEHRRAQIIAEEELSHLFLLKVDITSKSTVEGNIKEDWLHLNAKKFGKRLY